MTVLDGADDKVVCPVLAAEATLEVLPTLATVSLVEVSED
jgi:hypothetical protein